MCAVCAVCAVVKVVVWSFIVIAACCVFVTLFVGCLSTHTHTHTQRFSVVMITDYFAESLLVLKKQMCWPLDDVIYGAMKVRQQSKSQGIILCVCVRTCVHASIQPIISVTCILTPQVSDPNQQSALKVAPPEDPEFVRKVREYNWLDTLLFDHYNKTLWAKVEEYKV